MLGLGFLVKIVDKWNQRRTGEKTRITLYILYVSDVQY